MEVNHALLIKSWAYIVAITYTVKVIWASSLLPIVLETAFHQSYILVFSK